MRPFLTGLCRTLMSRRNMVAGLLGLLLGSVSGYVLIVWSNRNSAVVIRDERELGGSTTRNGTLDIYVELDRSRDCPAETSRWLWTWVEHNGERIKQFYPLANSATTITDTGMDQHLILSIPIPPGVWPGEWFYWSKTTEHCSFLPSLFRPQIRESLDIPIRIREEPQ